MQTSRDPNGHYCGHRVIQLTSPVRSNIILRRSSLSFATLEAVEIKEKTEPLCSIPNYRYVY